MNIEKARAKFHKELAKSILLVIDGVPTFADKANDLSKRISEALLTRIPHTVCKTKPKGQTLGSTFEKVCQQFLEDTFPEYGHLRPGKWSFGGMKNIAAFEQYAHLTALADLIESNAEIKASLGGDYIIKPDIVITRDPEADEFINTNDKLVTKNLAVHASLRKKNNERSLLHASISCKWTMRSDRAQNSRSEALNLTRNRKGRVPHIVVVTAEPLPSRLASLCLGTGDIDCVYHFALHELVESVESIGAQDAAELLDTMIQGHRLRDISDLPLDLSV